MKRLHTLLTICLCTLQSAIAAGNPTTGRLQGSVIDVQSQERLAGATVTILGTPIGATANAQGEFALADVPAGPQRIVIQILGYVADTLDITVTPGKDLRMEVYLRERQLEMQSIEIKSSAPQGLNLIQRLDLQLRPVASSQELLRTVPGLFIAQHAGGGKAEQIFLRGFDIDHGTDLALSMDGMPVNMVSHAHGQGYADAHFIIPEAVERLAIDKGPYSARQGNLATAGSIDYQTKGSLDRNLVKVELASYQQARALAMLKLGRPTGRSNQADAWVAGEYLFSKGYFESPQNLHRLNLMAKYRRLIGQRHLFTVMASDFRSKWNASGQIPERAVESGMITRWGSIDPTEGGTTSRSNLNLHISSTLPSGWTLRQQAYASRYDFNLYSNFTFFAEDSVHGDQIQQTERRWLYGYQGSAGKTVQLLGSDLQVEAGLGIRLDDVGNIGLYRTEAREFLSRIQQGGIRERNGFAWLSGRWAITDRLNLYAALRGDGLQFGYEDRMEAQQQQQRLTKGILSPKIGIDYFASERFHLFLKAGTGYHSNDTRVVLGPNQRQVLPRAVGADIGTTFKPTSSLLVQLAVWALDMQQEFVYVGDAGIVEPGGRSRRVGVDLSARWQVLKWLCADADLNLARPRGLTDTGEEEYIPLAPMLTSTGGLTAAWQDRLRGSIRYRLLGARPADEVGDLTATGYFLLDAALSYTLKGRHTLGLSVQNLLNTQWNEAQFATTSRLPGEPAPVTEIHYTPGMPIALKISLSTQF